MAQLTLLLLSGIIQAIRLYRSGAFILTNYLFIMAMLLMLSTFSSSVSLPFMFKLGVEKGRMAYLAMIAIVCAGSMAIYAISWCLSIRFYSRKEIR